MQSNLHTVPTPQADAPDGLVTHNEENPKEDVILRKDNRDSCTRAVTPF